MISQSISQKRWRIAPNGLFRSVGLFLLLSFVAILAGLVATTSSPLFVGIFAGLIGGGFLLARPSAAITAVISVGLMMGALLSLPDRVLRNCHGAAEEPGRE